MAAKKKAKAVAVPKPSPWDKAAAWAVLFSAINVVLTLVFIFCTSAELKARPTVQQVLEGFKAVDAQFVELKKGGAEAK